MAKVSICPALTLLGTILNLLFETNFNVMDADEGHSQTTKGVWMAPNDAGNILVFDIEGTDSHERGEERGVSKVTLVTFF